MSLRHRKLLHSVIDSDPRLTVRPVRLRSPPGLPQAFCPLMECRGSARRGTEVALLANPANAPTHRARYRRVRAVL